ncbi:MAG TPA: hypothetical protein PLX79_03890 [Candidatus Dojkabacteria bacterium]|nr:hypothetical protein [Candidatus Dojkabacteria bacterium]
MKKEWLVVITIFLLLVGALGSIYILKPQWIDYILGRNQNDGNGNFNIDFIQSPQDSEFTKKDLTYKYKYKSGTIPAENRNNPLGYNVASISYKNNELKVVIEHIQKCTDANEPPSQVGFYSYDSNKNIITLNAMIDPEMQDYPKECLVTLDFTIANLSIVTEPSPQFAFTLQNEVEGTILDICWYSNTTFMNGDIFHAEDGCNTCECIDGVSKCSTDKKCDTSKLSIYWGENNFDLFEKPQEQGECNTENDCHVGGCNGEVCSASPRVNTLCVVVEKNENAQCKCVANTCLWQ